MQQTCVGPHVHAGDARHALCGSAAGREQRRYPQRAAVAADQEIRLRLQRRHAGNVVFLQRHVVQNAGLLQTEQLQVAVLFANGRQCQPRENLG